MTYLIRKSNKADYFTGLGEITFFDEKGELRKIFKFMKGIFGTEGKIAKGFGAIQDAEDFVGDQSDLKNCLIS